MVNVTLKGGVVKEFENGTTAMEITKSHALLREPDHRHPVPYPEEAA